MFTKILSNETVVWTLRQTKQAHEIKITFFKCKHLADSEKPTSSLGEQILMKGKPESQAILVARAVFPAPEAPDNTTLTSGVLLLFFT